MKEQAKGQKQIDRENRESLKFYSIICLVGSVISLAPPILKVWSSEEGFAYGPFWLPGFG